MIAGVLGCEASAEPDEGYPPLEVQFTSSYSGGKEPYNFLWEFGDGKSSNEQNPKHTYQDIGKYKWKFTIRDGTGQSCIKEGEIEVKEKVYFKYFIPASANSKGGYNTNWKTDMVIYNKGNQTSEINLYLLEAGKDNRGSEAKRITVDAGKSYKIIDMVKSLFGKEDTSGGIKIISDQEVAITSRTYNYKEEGSYGQFVPFCKEEDGLKEGEEGILIQLTKNINFRTNIGFLNLKEENIDLDLSLYKEDGTFIGSKRYSLKPLEYFQENNVLEIFTNEEIENFFAKINIAKGNAFVYASVVDNKTGDAIFIPILK